MDWIITCRIQHYTTLVSSSLAYPVSQSVRSLFSKCALLVVLSNPINTCRQRHSGLLLLLQQLLAGQVSPRPSQVRSGACTALPFRCGPAVHAFIWDLACFDVHVHACVVNLTSSIFLETFFENTFLET